MSRLLQFCSSLLRHRVVLFSKPGHSGRLSHSESPQNQVLTPTESVVGIVVFFATFFIPAAYVMSNLKFFKGE
ncbi:cytochrome c oxidase subunit VIII isoform 3 [Rattus norvegicus]|uniref:Cytochrome c oxidase subunit 8C, mitochondrial n=2 Tax=Rattus norvegicus TaxID=10116 RepID=COX8C_RAT|nr:cytochrome c oxidase subunit 8C, mitochondrial [Rattus norvegicus]Q7TNN2.1 RecName: Full=Cytochrome c oxidase subunit 8C, mitochondrial; AltName: Full=Cytochrome c oxidase polypeptide 8 isoform 3; AltName: Full=Cytochrome c oxidase polypeptide VIII isoform 3; Short=COX VIII-3; AltName: Full=Cytochrome c oxidase subunit 8-3; Flags: Precursor [Rattus norvegicus]AAO26194.1 cytochrome c oxidase subunit VIII isoform 3 precursor [Rattus norvegicus]EDL81762.1 cytochrome c oxidase subunit VIII isofor|eukprot:NP_898878.1 cytochrome c oxidase subunit 8C, mitochondrial [Rattus norvegicus]